MKETKVLVKRTVKDQLYEIIKNRILSQEIALGEKINILTLSKELNVSNSPIREALSMLERDGLVEIMPNAGYRVTSFSEDLFYSIEQAVKTLICGSFSLLIEYGKEDELIEALENTLSMQVANYKTVDQKEYIRESMLFDANFIRCTDNVYLNRMYDELESLFTLVVLYNHSSIDLERLTTIEEHRKILSAVKDKNRDKAYKLIEGHYNKMPRPSDNN